MKFCATYGGKCVSICNSALSEDVCRSMGSCSWLSGHCRSADDMWMTYQSYPLEAALATLMTSVANIFVFWPTYALKGYLELIKSITQGQITSSGTCVTCTLQSSRSASAFAKAIEAGQGSSVAALRVGASASSFALGKLGGAASAGLSKSYEIATNYKDNRIIMGAENDLKAAEGDLADAQKRQIKANSDVTAANAQFEQAKKDRDALPPSSDDNAVRRADAIKASAESRVRTAVAIQAEAYTDVENKKNVVNDAKKNVADTKKTVADAKNSNAQKDTAEPDDTGAKKTEKKTSTSTAGNKEKGMKSMGIESVKSSPRAVILATIKYASLPTRDVIFAFYELVRAAVYVSNPNDIFDPEFVQFTRVMRDTINTLEFFIASASEAMLDIVNTVLKLLKDFSGLLTGEFDADQFLKNIIDLLADMFLVFEKVLFRLLMNIPGFDGICKYIMIPVNGLLEIILGFLCVVVTIINAIAVILGTDALQSAETQICRARAPNFCDAFDPANQTNVFEPTVCVRDADCDPQAWCWVNGASTTCKFTDYGSANTIQQMTRHDWVQPCRCGDFASTDAPFCNVATGFCQEGPSFFDEPLAQCPAGGSLGLVPSTKGDPHKHSLCYIMHTWRCSSKAQRIYGFHDDRWNAQNGSERAHLQAFTQCRWDMARNPDWLEGPFLCSDFCSPTVLHDDNRLLQVTTPQGNACICEVGIQSGSDHIFKPQVGVWGALPLSGDSLADDVLDGCVDKESQACRDGNLRRLVLERNKARDRFPVLAPTDVS